MHKCVSVFVLLLLIYVNAQNDHVHFITSLLTTLNTRKTTLNR